MSLEPVFGRHKALIGMVHLLPLPGSPRWHGSLDDVIERAVADARTLETGGIHGCLIENYGDAPYAPGAVEPATIAAMTRVLAAVRAAVRTPCGVNVLKNDARAALAVALAGGGCFIRVNVHVGAVVGDQGIIQGDAYTTLRDRARFSADVKIFADVQGKHALPLAPVELEQEARDAAYRGLADALVISGRATGEATPLGDVKRVRVAVPDRPLLIGSGATPETIEEILVLADGAIVGTALKRDGKVMNPVDPARVERLVRAARL